MTTDTSTAYRDETAHLRREVDRLTAELAKRDDVRPRWRVVRGKDGDMPFAAGVCLIVLLLAWCVLGCVFVASGLSVVVLRGLLVCGAMSAAWCLAFVRREAKS